MYPVQTRPELTVQKTLVNFMILKLFGSTEQVCDLKDLMVGQVGVYLSFNCFACSKTWRALKLT